MINITDLTKSFGSQVLLDNISFQINPKERVGLIGRNGHGKTTLFRIINGEDTPDEGEVQFPEGYKMGSLEQHINFTQKTVVEEACLGLPAEEKINIWKAEKILSGLGFSTEDQQKDPKIFSGGYQIRINLAKVLVAEPDLLLLDEPTNYLDIVSIRWLENFLKQWTGEIFVISHDRNFMDRICTHTIAIHRKKVKKIRGNIAKCMSQIQLEEDIYEKTRQNAEKERARQEKFIREFRSGARSAGLVQSRIKMLNKQEQKNKLARIQEIKLNFKARSFSSNILLNLYNVSFNYDGKRELIKNFSIDLNFGDKIAIIGKNGEGKSTFLKLLTGKLIPTTGNIKRYKDLELGYFSQTNQETLDPTKNIIEELQRETDITEQEARNIAGNMMFSGDKAYKKIEILSGGEKSRVSLGKILARKSHILLLDEPTNHLDLESCESLAEAIQNFEGTAFVVSHNEDILRKIAKKCLLFEDGNCTLFDCGYDEFLEKHGFADEGIKLKIPKQAKKQLDREAQKELSKKLRPLQNKINKLEKEIANTEQLITKAEEILELAHKQGSLLKIDEGLIELNKQQTKLYELNEEWLVVAEAKESLELAYQ